MRHVGIYVSDPSKVTLDPQQPLPPWAHIAIGLDRLGLLRENGVVPDWARPANSNSRHRHTSEWMSKQNIDCVLAIDEVQEAKYVKEGSSTVPGKVEYTPRSVQFWNSVDDSIREVGGPMLLLAGTGSAVGSAVYARQIET